MDVAMGKKHLRKDRRADFIHRLTLNGAALGAGNAGSLRGKLWTGGYDGVRTQIGFGMQSNWIGKSAGEIGRKLKRHKPQSPSSSP
jgi:hypothetical protein